MSDVERLVAAASEVRTNAYAPYSVYRVGAAVLGSDGRIYVGCNVENASYGLTVCAERTAIGSMVAAGCTRILAVAVVTQDGGTPCGMCRQVLAEFAAGPEVPIWIQAVDGDRTSTTVGELLPKAFQLDTENVGKENG